VFTPWVPLMTADERRVYASIAGAVELREDIVRHAGDSLRRAARFHRAVGVVVLLVGILQVGQWLLPAPRAAWLDRQQAAMTLALGAIWLFAAANVWCCRQRAKDSRADFLEFVRRLPVG
jgi:hypothetical protein